MSTISAVTQDDTARPAEVLWAVKVRASAQLNWWNDNASAGFMLKYICEIRGEKNSWILIFGIPYLADSPAFLFFFLFSCELDWLEVQGGVEDGEDRWRRTGWRDAGTRRTTQMWADRCSAHCSSAVMRRWELGEEIAEARRKCESGLVAYVPSVPAWIYNFKIVYLCYNENVERCFLFVLFAL